MTITQTVEFNINGQVDYLDIEFEGNPTIGNDSFNYSGTHCTNGKGGVHKLPNYITMEDSKITWDKTMYSPLINTVIEDYVKNNIEDLEEQICGKFAKTEY